MKKLLLILTFLLTLFSVNAAKYYISPTGVTGNTGTSVGSPKGTLAQVFTAFDLGSLDTIFVAAGTYTETGTTVGTNDNDFVIQGAALDLNGDPTSIFDAGSTARWLFLNNVANDNIVINRLTIKDHKNVDGGDPGGGGAIKVIAGAVGLTINYCIFDNCDTRTASLHHRGGAIYSAEAITVKYTTFRNCNAEYYGGAISVELSPSTNSIISYCKFYSNNSTGYGSVVFYGISTTKSLTITNSLFYENGNTAGSAVIVGMNTGSTINIMNCTITRNGNASYGTGGVLAVSSSKVYLTNTILYLNVGTTYNDAYNNSSTMSFINCLYGSSSEINSISPNTSPTIGDPTFVDVATDNYHLLSLSIAINKGTLTGSPTNDLDSETRIDNPDVGAYEYIPVSLPIELLYFKGDPHLIYNKLYWVTATENNNDYFNVYRSVDGVYFKNLFTIKGAGNSTQNLYYEVIDREFDPTINYYILRQTDFDGRWKDSDIISIDNRSDSAPTLVKVTNLLGQDVGDDATGVLIYHYSDGTILKRIH